jgi:iron complex outermembrane receptor protein
MCTDSFSKFLESRDCLQVYEGSQLVFSSTKNGLLPLLEYIDQLAPQHQPIIVFDKIMGNAAALLSVKAGCREVYSPLGSQLAVKTLDSYGIVYHLTEIVPYIQNRAGTDMCPMEKLSTGKEPEEFYKAVRDMIKGQPESA